MRFSLVVAVILVLLYTGCSSRISSATPPPVSSEETTIKATKPSASSTDNSVSKVEEVPEVPLISDIDWKLILVNDRNGISEDFEPKLEVIQQPYQVDSRVIPMLQQMISDAKNQNVTLMICSAYRPYSSQKRNFDASVARYVQQGYSREQAEIATLSLIAAPGYSEHQTGLAVDIVTPSYQSLNDGYAETDAARWLKSNAHNYGFILRYPKDKTNITHIDFEPWHYRYVGEKAAKVIVEKGICLEEYLGHA